MVVEFEELRGSQVAGTFLAKEKQQKINGKKKKGPDQAKPNTPWKEVRILF